MSPRRDLGIMDSSEPCPAAEALSRLELSKVGFTDDQLEALRAELFGPSPKGALVLSNDLTDDWDLCVRRRAVYDACMEKAYSAAKGESR